METKHTPGTWEINKEYPKRIQMKDTPENAPQTGAIAEVAKAYWKEGVMEANARLIAASPELLEACKKAVRILDINETFDRKKPVNKQPMANEPWAQDIIDTCKAAIAKAEKG